MFPSSRSYELQHRGLSGRAAIRTRRAGGGQRCRDLGRDNNVPAQARLADGVMRGAVEIGLRAAGGKMQDATDSPCANAAATGGGK